MRAVRQKTPDSLPPALKAAAEAQRQGRSGEARAITVEWLKTSPDDHVAMAILAAAAIDLSRPVEAEHILRRVLDLAPDFFPAWMHLARSLAAQARLRDAIAVIEDLLRRNPGSLPAGTYLAHLQSEAGQFDAAAETYRHLASANPDDPNLWAGYAQMLRFAGAKNDSENAFRRALKLDPANSMAWWGLSNLDPQAIGEQDEQRIAATSEAAPEGADGVFLHFALANVLDQRACRAEAFAHYSKANLLHRGSSPYDPDALSREVDESIGLFTRAFFERRKSCGRASVGPVFIIGMPRSGSTLLERMLGRHAEIEAMGELPIVPRMVDLLTAQFAKEGRYPASLRQLSCEQIGELGQVYLTRTAELRKTSKPLFTDKLHMNWRHLPFIHLILPQASFIDLRRNALDCCWSNYKLHFTRGHLASNDLSDLGRFYSDYVRLADHARAVAPECIIQLCFEQLVDDPAGELARILDFLGLEFDERCLDFHLADGPVGTASSEQVRQPLNRAGIGAAEPYRQWLGPLIEALGPLANLPG